MVHCNTITRGQIFVHGQFRQNQQLFDGVTRVFGQVTQLFQSLDLVDNTY